MMDNMDANMVEMLIADVKGDVESLAMRYKDIDEFRYPYLGKNHLIVSVLSAKATELLYIIIRSLEREFNMNDFDIQRAFEGLELYREKIKEYGGLEKAIKIMADPTTISAIKYDRPTLDLARWED